MIELGLSAGAARPTVLIHDDSYAGWVFDPTHPTQGRRFLLGAELIAKQGDVRVVAPDEASREQLVTVHTPDYVNRVLVDHVCDEWAGVRPDLSRLAARFVAGTVTALQELMSGRAEVAVHLPGGKHHAKADRSSGFCVFADLAIAAHSAVSQGHRVAILDIDAHHGDGTEELCRAIPQVLTFSVHQFGIFPGTGERDNPTDHIYNEPLAAGSGDAQLGSAIERFVMVAKQFQPTLLFIASGADGHRDDPLSNLNYTRDGFSAAGQQVQRAFPHLPTLVTGAGGYRPDDATPQSWAAFVAGVSGR